MHSTAEAVEHAVAISEGSTISKGSAAPAAARSEITVVGKSCMLEALTTRNMHMASLARVLSGAISRMPRIASIPAGVAALPSPSMLAERLAAMASQTASFPRTMMLLSNAA